MSTEVFLNLTNQIIDSDEKAFEDLFRMLYAPLVKFSYKYVKDKSAASDIVQETFINVWQIRDDLSRNQSIKTYLFRAVRNLSLNHIRDEARVINGLEPKDLMADENSNFDQSNKLLKNKRMNMVRDWIRKLPERQMEVLKMSRFEGLSHKEIAEILDISKRTVNNHIVQAMKNLKQYHDEDTKIKL